jgi:hypothetical protein
VLSAVEEAKSRPDAGTKKRPDTQGLHPAEAMYADVSSEKSAEKIIVLTGLTGASAQLRPDMSGRDFHALDLL